MLWMKFLVSKKKSFIKRVMIEILWCIVNVIGHLSIHLTLYVWRYNLFQSPYHIVLLKSKYSIRRHGEKKKPQHFNESDQNECIAAKHLHQFKLWKEGRFSRSVKKVNAKISERFKLFNNATYGYLKVGFFFLVLLFA